MNNVLLKKMQAKNDRTDAENDICLKYNQIKGKKLSVQTWICVPEYGVGEDSDDVGPCRAAL